jgi:hypothetical protein
MICALSEADLQKVVSYVSFLRFAGISDGKLLADLLDEAGKMDALQPKKTTPDAAKPEPAPKPMAEEVLKTEVLKTEIPKPEVPKVEIPKVETPKPEIPKVEPPQKADAPKTVKEEITYTKSWMDESVEFFGGKVKEEPHPAPATDQGAGFFTDADSLNDFYAPVRSSRLDDSPDRGSAQDIKDKYYMDSEPFPVSEEKGYFDGGTERKSAERTPRGEVSGVEDASKTGGKPHASPAPSDDFFMPVRSERFDELRRSSEPEQPPRGAARDVRDFLAGLSGRTEGGTEKSSAEGTAGERPKVSSLFSFGSAAMSKFTKSDKNLKNAEKAEELPKIEKPEPSEKIEEPMVSTDFEKFTPPQEPKKAPFFPTGSTEQKSGPEGGKKVSEPTATGKQLVRLRKILGLSCEDLAFLFEVSPGVLYSWFSDRAPNAAQQELLLYCLEVADRVEQVAVPRIGATARRPFPDGELFLHKLKRQKITGQDLKILKEMAQRVEELRRKPKGATKPFHPFQHTVTLYSTPLYCEV